MGCCGCKDDNVNDFYMGKKEEKMDCKQRACCISLWTLIVFAIIFGVLFILIFVVLPIVFMNSVELQRFVVFPNYDQPSNPQYENYKLYGAKGVYNRYKTIPDVLNASRLLSLGIWQVVHEDRIAATEAINFDYNEELKSSKKPIALYFHGQSGTRIYPLPTYNVMREFFQVLAFDYRSYGDSSAGLLTEHAVVEDAIQLYMWLLKATDQKEIYFWGHSLGTALSTHTLKKLTERKKTSKEYNNIILPRGLILEAPFTSMREEVQEHPLAKIFAWLPWFKVTIVDPFEENGFLFRTNENIKKVECPIMILHAEDDSVIPYQMGEELAKIAKENKGPGNEDQVHLHIVPASVRANHMGINTYKKLPEFIGDFVKMVSQIPQVIQPQQKKKDKLRKGIDVFLPIK